MKAEDDPQVPLAHRHDAEGRRYARWKERGGIGGWNDYQRWKSSQRALLEPASEATPEQRAAAFRRDNAWGDLSDEERAMLEVGVAPRLTGARLLRRGAFIVAGTLVWGTFPARVMGASWSFVLGMLVSGALVGVAAVVMAVRSGDWKTRPSKRPKKRR
jgi:hypothetical protein